MNEYYAVSLIRFYIKIHLPTSWESPFLQKAKAEEIRKRKSVYDGKESDHEKPFVMNTFNTVQKRFAKQCKFANWER